MSLEGSGLELKSFPNQGKGLVILRDFSEHGIIFKCDRKLCLNYETLSKDEKFQNLMTGKPRFIVMLAMYVLYLKKFSSEQFKSWVKILPKEFPNLPLLMSENVVQILPDCLQSECQTMQKRLKNDFDVARICSIFDFSWDEFSWAFAVVHTRCIKWPGNFDDSRSKSENIEDDIDYALVPYADFFNHDSRYKVSLKLKESEIIFESEKSQIRGNQAFICYGNHSNAYFLLQYGFVPEINHNDFMELTLDQLLHISQYSDEDKNNLRNCVAKNADTFSKPYLYADGLSVSLVRLVYITVAEPEIWDDLLQQNFEQNIRKLTNDYHDAAKALFLFTLKFVQGYVDHEIADFMEKNKEISSEKGREIENMVLKFLTNWSTILKNVSAVCTEIYLFEALSGISS